jgi:hypothetical protein
VRARSQAASGPLFPSPVAAGYVEVDGDFLASGSDYRHGVVGSAFAVKKRLPLQLAARVVID